MEPPAVVNAGMGNDGDSVFGPILLRSSTPPPDEKVNQFLQSMQAAHRVAKPESNYGSEFDHMSAGGWENNAAINLMSGPTIRIPPDAQETHDLNDELFNQGDGSELSYNGALENNNTPQPVPFVDEVESVAQERASTVYRTPAVQKSVLQTPKSPFRAGKIIDSSSSWGNKGPLPMNNPNPPPIPSQYPDTPAFAAQFHLPPGTTPDTPHIKIQPPTDPAASSRQHSRTPSRIAASETGRSKAEKTRSQASEVVIENQNAWQDKVSSRAPSRQGTVKAETVKGGNGTEKTETVRPKSPTVRNESRAPSRNGARSPTPSRTPSKVDPTFSPPRTERSRRNGTVNQDQYEPFVLATPTPSKIALPMSPGAGYDTPRTIPLGFGPPAKSQRSATVISEARSRATRSKEKGPTEVSIRSPAQKSISLAKAPTRDGQTRSRAPSTRQGTTRDVKSPTSPTVPSRLRPDVESQESATSVRDEPQHPSRAVSVRSGYAGHVPPITVQPSEAARSQAARSQAGRSRAGSQAGQSQAGKSQAAQSQAAQSQAAQSQAARAQSQAVRSQAIRSQAAQSQTAQSQAARSQAPRSIVIQSQTSRSQASQSQVSQSQVGGSEDHEDDEDDTEDERKAGASKQVTEIDLTRTPRTSYTVITATPSAVAGDVKHFHDEELCVLLHAADNDSTHDVVKKALHKGVRERVKKLGLDHQTELMKARMHHKQGRHRQRVLKAVAEDEESSTPPKWAMPLFDLLHEQQQTIERLEESAPAKEYIARLETVLSGMQRRRIESHIEDEEDEDEGEGTIRGPEQDQVVTNDDDREYDYDEEEGHYGTEAQTPHMTVAIETPHHDHHEFYDDDGPAPTAGDDIDDSPNKNLMHDLEDDDNDYHNPHVSKAELYRLRVKAPSGVDHVEWNVAHTGATRTEALPEIPGSEVGGPYYEGRPHEEVHHEVEERRGGNGPRSPPLPPLPLEANGTGGGTVQHWPATEWQDPAMGAPSWQRVYQRLLNWAVVWSDAELQRALDSTAPGHHVDEVALTIWLTQTYKRYVRAKYVEHPQGVVDRLYIPPNIADAINVAVFNGRHGDAKAMLRDLWTPLGFQGMPRLLIVLARHRRDANHHVVHRFSLPEGSLTTYDTYPEKTLPDGRPLGWWFAIQAAWPHGMYPQPDNLVQKIIRIDRPMQLNVDHSIAAAAIWRNLIMGSKAERSVDLVRLRDLVNSEVKSLMSRKDMGRLSVLGGKYDT